MLTSLPSLAELDPTRNTLHAYAKVIGAIPRALAKPHPKWWHISLKVGDTGLQTDAFTVGDGRTLQLSIDFERHVNDLTVDGSESLEVANTDGLSAIALANLFEEHLINLEISVQLDRQIIEGPSVEGYDPAVAQQYFGVLKSISGLMEEVKETLEGDVGIINFWPHNFDLAFEWFSEKMITSPGEGESVGSPAQINFGFAPGDNTHARPYLYSNPWPFDEVLTEVDLPSGARWFQDSWQGSILPYDSIVGDVEYASKLKEYYRTIFNTASPGLLP